MNQSLIQAISEKHLAEIPLEINRMTIGICNEVYELKYQSDSYILRMNKEKEWIYGTHKFLPLFQKLEIKTPSIVAEDYSKSEFPFCYQIQTKLDGKDLLVVFKDLSESNLTAIAKEVSLIYDKFNTLPYEKNFGGLTGINEGNEASLLSIIKDQKKNIIERNKHSKVIAPEIMDLYEELIEGYTDYFHSVRPKLYYDDMSSKNVMIYDGKFNGLVDLDFLMKGDYLQGIGGIIADWYGSERGEFYINEILKHQKLDEFQQKVVKVYAIFHLIGWTSEEGIRFNGNSSGEINWSNVEKKRKKIMNLYKTIN
jgi:hypothetical protein